MLLNIAVGVGIAVSEVDLIIIMLELKSESQSEECVRRGTSIGSQSGSREAVELLSCVRVLIVDYVFSYSGPSHAL